MANVVLIIDMLRGFLEAGYPLGNPELKRIVPFIQQLVERELSHGSRIIFIADSHAPNDTEFRMFPPHCIRGTTEAEVIPELAKYPGELMPKRRYSAFFGTPLEQWLQELKPEKVIVVGVLTNICVLHTVADARNRDYIVEVPAAGVDSPDARMHEFALEHIEKVLGAKVIR